MNDFRSRIQSADNPAGHLLKAKNPRDKRDAPAAGDENLGEVVIPREEVRAADHRFEDRHRLAREAAITVRHKRKRLEVALVNLSGGGAMIECDAPFKLWDKVVLELAGGDPRGRIECAVRWIKHGRTGLEFAPETHIDADRATCDALLREVLEKSFADVEANADPLPAAFTTAGQFEAGADADGGDREESRRDELRHPMIWHGHVHFDYDSHKVRLRNISTSGALIESAHQFPIGAEIMLDLGEGAGHVFAQVSWSQGDQFGLAFTAPFDLARLAAAKPQVAIEGYVKPDYLKDDSRESSPWASQWGRLSVAQLKKTLGR
ncbi:PilZ domain-containing protein [Sphingomonas sp. KRR8]|uniref:PilZ domain-containing protein n=1 Tax=Sphingomonas sp. KRR8 TaxID=2942996 RepID=UPI0020213416|nr:PilZ domain-containing protein [Sphingomonas sp. KRR8]URD62062.1 PilZ domain-containing protein [Sphingomonas sp. KRR8]